MESKPLFVFPKWSNKLALSVIVAIALAPTYLIVLVAYGLSPVTLNVGYEPEQPIHYSHAKHAGKVGIDCRTCHTTVEKAAFAAIPPTDVCMNCHTSLFNNTDPKKASPELKALFASAATGDPIKWIKVNDLPDFVFFNHSAHINVGMSCVECHGNVNHMETVYQAKPLNMGWCLECHRDPAARIRPKNRVFDLDWKPGPEDETVVSIFATKMKTDADSAKAYVEKLAKSDPGQLQREMGVELLKLYHANPNTDCVTCHR
jgi:hypothetical protein